MSAESLRFIHAAQLRLEAPLRGVPPLPAEWRARVFQAAAADLARLVDAALAAEVDGVLLTGAVLGTTDPAAWTWGLLRRELARLRAAEIPVVWGVTAAEAAALALGVEEFQELSEGLWVVDPRGGTVAVPHGGRAWATCRFVTSEGAAPAGHVGERGVRRSRSGALPDPVVPLAIDILRAPDLAGAARGERAEDESCLDAPLRYLTAEPGAVLEVAAREASARVLRHVPAWARSLGPEERDAGTATLAEWTGAEWRTTAVPVGGFRYVRIAAGLPEIPESPAALREILFDALLQHGLPGEAERVQAWIVDWELEAPGAVRAAWGAAEAALCASVAEQLRAHPEEVGLPLISRAWHIRREAGGPLPPAPEGHRLWSRFRELAAAAEQAPGQPLETWFAPTHAAGGPWDARLRRHWSSLEEADFWNAVEGAGRALFADGEEAAA